MFSHEKICSAVSGPLLSDSPFFLPSENIGIGLTAMHFEWVTLSVIGVRVIGFCWHLKDHANI